MNNDKFLDTVEFWLKDFNLNTGVLYNKLKDSYLKWKEHRFNVGDDFHKQNLLDFTSAWLWCEWFDYLRLTNRPQKAEKMANAMRNIFLAQV